MTRKQIGEVKRLDELENKILYAYFLHTCPDILLQELAGDYLKGKELKEYRKLLDTV